MSWSWCRSCEDSDQVLETFSSDKLASVNTEWAICFVNTATKEKLSTVELQSTSCTVRTHCHVIRCSSHKVHKCNQLGPVRSRCTFTYNTTIIRFTRCLQHCFVFQQHRPPWKVFSQGGIIVRSRGAKTNDDLLEMLLYLHCDAT